ncbi:ABC transporter permease [Spiroplasma turonicum]|uniref:ABC transporter permease n=1 Tax=Spiroplasma turonicum TaxID=216946 RepID=A0A0K1P5T6_9MOLU|nr:ABC transporter permease [Spiroplasma turonicum]AKU79615.1 ABC transporter permease [Spiroplasma turonicum]ALX70637.1 ABC transporter permease [Spiroplasma turonicum]
MKIQKPFFKNSFKNLIKNKIQLIAILILVLLSSFMFTASFSSTSRINNSYNDFISESKSNLHDFTINLDGTTYENDFEKDSFKNISDTGQRDNLIISYLQDKLENSDDSFIFDRVESRNFKLSDSKTIKAITLNPYQKVDKFVVSKGMSLNKWKDYNNSINDYTKNWVYISENFANKNNIKINDIVRLQEDEFGSSVLVENSEKKKVNLSKFKTKDINLWKSDSNYSQQNWFQVVGFGSSADFSSPIINEEKPLPDTNNEGLFYLNPENFGYKYAFYDSIYSSNEFNFSDHENRRVWVTNNELKSKETLKANSSSDIEVSYSGKFISNKNKNTDLINDYLTNLSKASDINLYASYSNKLQNITKVVYSLDDSSYKYYSRTDYVNKALSFFKLLGYIVTGITLLIAIIMLIIMIKNDLKKAFSQIGVLISLGYKKTSLVWATSLYPIFISLIGGILGYFIGTSIQELVVNVFNNFFQIEMQSFNFSWESILVNIFGIFIFLEIITLVTYFYVLNSYKPLEMIHYENKKATSKFNLFAKKILTNRKKFDSRFRGAILSSSLVRLLSVFLVISTSSFLITLGTIIPGILQSNLDKTYNNSKYNNLVEYESPIYNSPKSFSKTYNPDSTIDNFDSLTSDEIANMYINNNISNKVFKPSDDLSSLNDLTYKNIDIDYLKNFNLNIDGIGSNVSQEQKDNFTKITILNLWKDLKNFKLDKYWKKESLLKVILSNSSSAESIDDLEAIRLFYSKYKNSIGLSDVFANEKRKNYFLEYDDHVINTDDNLNKNVITNSDLKALSLQAPLIHLDDNGKIEDDDALTFSLYNFVNQPDWESQRIYIIVSIYNWFQALFYNNFQQAFLQGIYNNSPTTIKEIILQNYNNDSGYYNISFGTTPYNNETDDLGVYLNATYKSEDLKIYGVEKNNKTLNLINSSKENLINNISDSEDGILINQSLAKRLKLSIGDKINVNHLINSLSYKSQEVKMDSWNYDDLNAKDSEGFTNTQEIYNNSLFDNKVSDWKNQQINENNPQNIDGYVYKSNIDLNSESSVSANLMSQKLAEGLVTKNIEQVNFEYTVKGIVDKYGSNKAWINNSTAKKITKYDLAEKYLFNVFMKEWENPKNNKNLTSLIDFIKNNKTKENAYELFVEFTNNSENSKYMDLFNNQYPIFNYKSSLNADIIDITKGVSTTQLYGDYSMFGLNGGSTTQRDYNSFSTSSISTLDSITEAKKVISRINDTIFLILLLIIVVWTILSGVIILLTINLVINDNRKIISSMKILGYKDLYIARLFIFIYVPVVIISALLGFSICYIAVFAALPLLYSTIVLPIIFQWWYLIPGILGSWLLYIFSVNLSWFSLKRLNMLHIVLGG